MTDQSGEALKGSARASNGINIITDLRFPDMQDLTDQLYFNKATNTFRIVSNDGTKYIEVAFAAPIGSVGAKVQASVKSEGFEDVENFDSIEFEIMKKEGQNCWLWCQAHALGVLAFYIP